MLIVWEKVIYIMHVSIKSAHSGQSDFLQSAFNLLKFPMRRLLTHMQLGTYLEFWKEAKTDKNPK